jgi:N-acetylmuramoyl-L-alanine amidase
MVRTSGSGRPVAGAELRAGVGGRLLGYTNPDGRFAVPEPAEPIHVTARGHLPAAASRGTPLLGLTPVLGGVLFDRPVAIDPAGGGADPLAVSATGLRAADATLEAGRAFAAELERAGARPILVRADDRTLSDLARVEVAEAAEPDLYVRFGAAASPRVRHYPGSRRGKELAVLVAQEIAAESGLTLPVAEEVTPILQLTSVPAVEVLLPTPTDAQREDQLLDAALPRQLGRAVALALAAERGLAITGQGTARLATTSPSVLLDGRTIVSAPRGGGPILLRALEPAPAWHDVAPFDLGQEPANPTPFSVPPADTVDLRL